MRKIDEYHGGLVFYYGNDHGIEEYCRVVSSTLEDYDHKVMRQSILPDGQARINAGAIVIDLKLDCATRRRRLVLTMKTAGQAAVAANQAQLILLVTLYRMIEAYTAKSVEWLEPDVILPAGQFMSAFAKVSPRRVRARQEILEAGNNRFASVEDTAMSVSGRYDQIQGQPVFAKEGPVDIKEEEALAMTFRAGPRPDEIDGKLPARSRDSNARRLAAWSMTGVVTCVSGPVGLAMAAVNLARGEDFRLNTQVLALTGFCGVVTSTGAIAQVAAALPM